MRGRYYSCKLGDMNKDPSYAAARLLFYTEPTDRALIGWQPFNPYPADQTYFMGLKWDYSVEAEARNIAAALGEVCDS
jgi:hypothetical protein